MRLKTFSGNVASFTVAQCAFQSWNRSRRIRARAHFLLRLGTILWLHASHLCHPGGMLGKSLCTFQHCRCMISFRIIITVTLLFPSPGAHRWHVSVNVATVARSITQDNALSQHKRAYLCPQHTCWAGGCVMVEVTGILRRFARYNVVEAKCQHAILGHMNVHSTWRNELDLHVILAYTLIFTPRDRVGGPWCFNHMHKRVHMHMFGIRALARTCTC